MSSKKSDKNRDNFEHITWKELIRNNKNLDLIMSEEQMIKILDRIGNSKDDKSFIINKKTGIPELAIDSAEIKTNELGAVLPGSKVFIRKNIAGFSQYLSEYCD